MQWQKLTCRSCGQRYSDCACFTTARLEQERENEQRRQLYAKQREQEALAAMQTEEALRERRRQALELAIAKVRA